MGRVRQIKVEIENEDLNMEITHEIWTKNLKNQELEQLNGATVNT